MSTSKTVQLLVRLLFRNNKRKLLFGKVELITDKKNRSANETQET